MPILHQINSPFCLLVEPSASALATTSEEMRTDMTMKRPKRRDFEPMMFLTL